jgi:hypothetical protein
VSGLALGVIAYQAPRIVDCRGMHASEWRPDLGYWVCTCCGVALDEKRRPGGLDGHWVSPHPAAPPPR